MPSRLYPITWEHRRRARIFVRVCRVYLSLFRCKLWRLFVLRCQYDPPHGQNWLNYRGDSSSRLATTNPNPAHISCCLLLSYLLPSSLPTSSSFLPHLPLSAWPYPTSRPLVAMQSLDNARDVTVCRNCLGFAGDLISQVCFLVGGGSLFSVSTSWIQPMYSFKLCIWLPESTRGSNGGSQREKDKKKIK